MKKLLYVFTLALFLSCTTTTPRDDSKKIKPGWKDEDTYTVVATATNLDKAIEQAKYQILKDIVNVRCYNNSRYTDIIKIREEFDTPLKNGEIINKRNVPDGIEIYFQIRDTGLKKKFQRK